MRNRRALWVCLIAAIAIVGATGYAFRARLSAPFGAMPASNAQPAPGPQAASGAERTQAPSPGAPIEPGGANAPHAEPAGMTARGEVTIDPRRQQLIGVRTVPVKRGTIERTVRAVGLVRYDETRLADVNLKLEGWIRDLYVDYTGHAVQKGQPLFTLYSPEVLTTQNEYVLALKAREQMQSSQVPDAREFADRLVTFSRQRLALWDLPAEQIDALEQTREPQTAVLFRSPLTGFVIEKPALKGMHVMPGQTLYKIADLSVVWVEADVYEGEIALMRLGAPATITVDAYPGERFTGRAIYVYPTMDEKTRTVRVRFEFANRTGRLKPGMYANAELRGPATVGLTVPVNAVLDSGKQQLVFVSQGEGYFEPRNVKIGLRSGDAVEIVEGLKEGEEVATGATFFLDSESQLRASVQGYEAAPATAPAAGVPRERLDITFRSQPDPPKTGENLFEISVKEAEGVPIADAEVSVLFFMAPMPTMNMPAMRNEVKLPAVGGGVYRGPGEIIMAGVSRGGQRLGSKQLTVTAR
ncbi:MAG: Cation efflux system protein CusB [Chromatiales bacterium USCg_Taylor]|nr:MAG: Cation efflux system protein CusB [Chromatiales bacterium USCg_Taylor]